MPAHDELSAERIDSIAALTEPVLRNLLITQCYCELSAAFAKYMGPVTNWCTFATWASKQAGETVRHEDLQRTLTNLLKNEPAIEATLSLAVTLAKQSGARQSFDVLRNSTLSTMVSQAANHAADAVSLGNKKVFEEIAREFSRFITGCAADTTYNQLHIDTFCEKLKPGPPPDGQAYLAKGFICYYAAIFEQETNKKSQLNLLANLCIGFHEQNRLQPEISAALNSSIDAEKIKSDLLNKLFSGENWWTRLRLFFKRLFGVTLLDKAIEALIQLVQQHLRRILTAHLMTITLPPDNRLNLGKDLTMTYPADLMEFTNADLLSLLTEIDPTPNSVLESGATDWANLKERMHFIADMFRCFHHSAQLFNEAFTSEQIATMKNGRLPGGSL